MADRGDKLRLLLKGFELQTPPQQFTKEVIAEIEAMADDKVYANSALGEMLKKNSASIPSAEFTYKVLNKVRQQQPQAHPPIISKKVWALIVGFVALCLIVAFVNEFGGNAAGQLHYSLPVADYLGNLSTRFREPLFYICVIFLSGGLLLLFDFLLMKLRLRSAD